jgi:hypothetical protein
VNLSALRYGKNILSRIAYLVVVLFRKKIVLAASVYTTFSNTITEGLTFLTGSTSSSSLVDTFVTEAGNKFFGAAPNILEGLKSFNNLEVVQAGLSLWTAFASIYMLLFIYKMFRSKGMTSNVEWPETMLVLLVWLLSSSIVHGSSLFIGVVEELKVSLETVSQVLPTSDIGGMNETVQNMSTNTTK